MTELEKVEKLREKADVSFADAKEALEANNGDILDALIYLEEQGKATVPAGGGYFSGATAQNTQKHHSQSHESSSKNKGESFGDMMKRFGRFMLMLLRKGNSNFLEARKGDKELFTIPVTAVALFLLFLFWVTIPLFIISLFCGVRYHFRGEDLGRDSVNSVLDKAASVVEDAKKTYVDNKEANDDDDDDDDNDDVDEE
ncbi:MAG: ubiquitin [Oscillospiraceae bacterium]|nr:ubiquitin [Oscillospiraceae bacterium]